MDTLSSLQHLMFLKRNISETGFPPSQRKCQRRPTKPIKKKVDLHKHKIFHQNREYNNTTRRTLKSTKLSPRIISNYNSEVQIKLIPFFVQLLTLLPQLIQVDTRRLLMKSCSKTARMHTERSKKQSNNIQIK